MNHSQKRKFKGVLSSFMATTLAASLVPISHATDAETSAEEVVEQQTLSSSFTDIGGHWGSEAILRWANYGILTGRGDGTFDPDSPISRAEIAVVLSELMGYEVISDTYFADLSGWSEEFCRKLNAAGYMNGKNDNMMAPYDNVSREEFATILYQALHLEPQTFSYGSFADSAQISSWAQTGVATLYHYGITKGTGFDSSNKPYFSPYDLVTRAEVVQMLHSAINLYIKGADDVSTSLSKTTVIHSEGKDVTFSGTKVYGDLIIAEGTGEGSVYLNDIEVIDGDIIIKGGGSQSIYLDNVKVESGEIVVDRMKDAVRVVFSGNSVAPQIKVGNNATIVANDLGAESSLGTVTITGGDAISVSGTFAELINQSEGVTLDISGIIDRIYMEASGYVNGSFVVGGTEFDSNSIPQSDVNITEPELTIGTDFGSAAGDSPSATAEILSTSFNESTAELTVEIEVRDIENCVLMAEDANGITVSNPSGAASLDRLELDVTSSHKSSYSLYTVVIKMTQNYTTIPLSVNFKSEDDLAVPVITKNFNGISSASATVTLDDDIDYRTSTAYAYVTVSSIRNCELHYLDELAITSDQDEDTINLDITMTDYGDDWAEYRIQYTYTDIDSLELDMNFLREGAEESVPNLTASYVHEDSDGEYGGGEADVTYESPDLDKYGNIVFDITISNLSHCQLMGSVSKSITIDAESGDREAGYGQDFDVELSHDGKYSTYTVTFEPNGYATDIEFLVNLDDKDEGIPVITAYSSLSRIEDDLDEYFVINENTISISRSTVSFEVQVKNMDDLEGYKTPTKSSIVVQEPDDWTSTTDNFYVEKLDDELYAVSFTTVHKNDDEDSPVWDVDICLDLEVSSNYVALFAGTAREDTSNVPYFVPAANLPYAVKSSSTTSADRETYDYERKITFSAVSDVDLTTGHVSVLYYKNSDGDFVATATGFKLLDNDDGSYTIYFTPQNSLSVNDVAFYIAGVSRDESTTDTYVVPKITFADDTNGKISSHSSTQAGTTATVTFKTTDVTEGYELTGFTSSGKTISYTTGEDSFTFANTNTDSSATMTITPVFELIQTQTATEITISTKGYSSNKYESTATQVSTSVELPSGTYYADAIGTITFTSLPTLRNYECIGFGSFGSDNTWKEMLFIENNADVVSSTSITYSDEHLAYDDSLTLYPIFRQTTWTASTLTGSTSLDNILTNNFTDTYTYTYPVIVDVTYATNNITNNIPANMTMNIESGCTVTVSDEVTNNGTINVESDGKLTVSADKSLTNKGTITIDNGGAFTNSGGFANKKTLTVNGDAENNTTNFTVNSGSTLTIGETGTFTVAQAATLTNDGIFDVSGTLTIAGSGTGDTLIRGTLDGAGTLTVQPTGTVKMWLGLGQVSTLIGSDTYALFQTGTNTTTTMVYGTIDEYNEDNATTDRTLSMKFDGNVTLFATTIILESYIGTTLSSVQMEVSNGTLTIPSGGQLTVPSLNPSGGNGMNPSTLTLTDGAKIDLQGTLRINQYGKLTLNAGTSLVCANETKVILTDNETTTTYTAQGIQTISGAANKELGNSDFSDNSNFTSDTES